MLNLNKNRTQCLAKTHIVYWHNTRHTFHVIEIDYNSISNALNAACIWKRSVHSAHTEMTTNQTNKQCECDMPGCCASTCHVHLFDESNELWIITLHCCRPKMFLDECSRNCGGRSEKKDAIMGHRNHWPSPAQIIYPNLHEFNITTSPVTAALAELSRVEFNLF